MVSVIYFSLFYFLYNPLQFWKSSLAWGPCRNKPRARFGSLTLVYELLISAFKTWFHAAKHVLILRHIVTQTSILSSGFLSYFILCYNLWKSILTVSLYICNLIVGLKNFNFQYSFTTVQELLPCILLIHGILLSESWNHGGSDSGDSGQPSTKH